MDLVPGWGIKTLHATWCSQKKTQPTNQTNKKPKLKKKKEIKLKGNKQKNGSLQYQDWLLTKKQTV